MKIYLEKRGCDIMDDSPVIQEARKGGITNHRYFCEVKQPRKGREGKETGTCFEFCFHDWSGHRLDRNHMQAQGRNPDEPQVHTELCYYDMKGMCWGVVKANGWIDGSLKAIQTFIRKHGYPDAEVEVKEA